MQKKLCFKIKDKSKFISPFLSIISFFCIILFWTVLAKIINSSFVMPKPTEVFFALKNLFSKKSFYLQIFATMFRSLYAFILSFFISLFLGTLCGFSKTFSKLFDFPLGIIKAAPVVSFILCALFLFSTNTVPIFVSVLMTLPVMTTSIATGIQNIDTNLLQMSQVYSFSKKQKIKYIYIPSIKTYLFSGMISSFALSWKVVVASEVLCLPKFSLGTAMYTAKVHLETAEVFAISFVVIFLSFICEKFFTQIFKKKKKESTK
ncbi:MAG: hypothetical protein GX220_09530 [Treponema sp.]|nr:hypothetical protein [Treponema sp.]